MDLHPGDIILIEVQFHQTQGAKVRPAIVVLDSGDEICCRAGHFTGARR
jgi:hypothetical protein